MTMLLHPLFLITAAKCDVFMPGDAQASMTSIFPVVGKSSTVTGKQLA